MNRREALATLTALPHVATVSVADVRSGDVIVIECPGFLSEDAAHNIKQHMEAIWPRNQVCVLTDGITMKVVRQT